MARAPCLHLTLHTQAGDTPASATVLHGKSPRLLSFDGIDIEAPLQGNLAVCFATATFRA